MSNQMPFRWAPAPIGIAQFASRVREACTGVGHITVVAIGYEYSARDGMLYRVIGGSWQPLGDAMEMMELSDEELYKRCREG